MSIESSRKQNRISAIDTTRQQTIIVAAAVTDIIAAMFKNAESFQNKINLHLKLIKDFLYYPAPFNNNVVMAFELKISIEIS